MEDPQVEVTGGTGGGGGDEGRLGGAGSDFLGKSPKKSGSPLVCD